MVTLDCRGQQCPQPVVQVRRQMLATPGAPLTVLVSDPAARDNIGRLAAGSGYQMSVHADGNEFRLELTPATPAASRATAPVAGPTVLLVTAEQMGQGDAQLGRILMKNFLFTLTETESLPDLTLFVNGGARLTTAGSEVIEALQALADRGVDIATCGLCLEFFGLKDALSVGRTTNMLEIVTALQTAGRIVRP